MFSELLEEVYFGNSVLLYLQSTCIIIVGVVGVGIIRFFVLRRLHNWAQKTETQYDDLLIGSIQKFLVPLIYFGVVYLALKNLSLGEGISKGLSALYVVMVTFAGILFVNHLIRFFVFNIYAKKFPDQPDISNRFRALMPAVTVFVWLVGSVFLLDNLGFQISAIMAGLGIGGVAVALAASVVLNDLFAYFAIMFDQPFVIGDFIIVGDFLGSVEKIGIKTTRIRSLGGELLIFSNKDLTDSRIRNYKRMDRRRVVFKLGVTYDTPLEKMKEIPPLIHKIITETDKATYDRAHFSSYGDFNLVVEVVYYVESADYNKYMDIQQAINFAIKKEFEKRGIQFAFPTQTLYVEGLAALAKAKSVN